MVSLFEIVQFLYLFYRQYHPKKIAKKMRPEFRKIISKGASFLTDTEDSVRLDVDDGNIIKNTDDLSVYDNLVTA